MRKRTRPAEDGTSYHRILWPTDLSPLAKTALPHVLGLASHAGAEVVLLHVLPSAAMYVVPPKMGTVLMRLQREARAAAQAQLRRLERQLQAPGIHAHAVLAMGVPFQQIVLAAKRLRCDLIVLATHGQTGLAHAVLGSVAENVVRHAPCPVLTVRPERIQGRD
jgi:nucleotide-binding universal stress UspA family protein